ncbi:unnamed protein product [Peniophora sp. CBMAI 1063]|nr:unnamed protein product [Peniophora sp. CBMAI 1063]
MDVQTTPALHPLFHIPVELLTEIVIFAQLIWYNAAISSHHDTPGGLERMQGTTLQTPVRRASPCCELVPRKKLPHCCQDNPVQVERSPAHCLIQTNQFFRKLITESLPWLWNHDNALFKEIAKYSGSTRLPRSSNPEDGYVKLYGANNLIASHACTCLLRAIHPFYETLRVVKVSMPWDAPSIPDTRGDVFFSNDLTIVPSPLQHFDLELFDSPRAPVGITVRSIERENLLTFCGINIAFCFSSKELNSFYMSFPLSRRARFGASFTNGLLMCAGKLEYLTLEAGSGEALGAHTLSFPNLRFLRLVLPLESCARMLSRMRLPAQLDMHLEPVVQWRSQAARRVRRLKQSAHNCEAPLAELDNYADRLTGNNFPCALWRFACALAAPDQTRGIFQDTATFHIRPENLWHTFQAVSFEIRQDPSMHAFEREPLRFPELVGVVLAHNVEDIRLLQAEPGWDWRHSLEPGEKDNARRSLIVRDGQYSATSRNALYRSRYVKPLYDVIAYVTTVVLKGRPGTPFAGKQDIASLVISEASFVPNFSLGWRHMLAACDEIEQLVIRRIYFSTQQQEQPAVPKGHIVSSQLNALALYLNDVPGPGQVPCSRLRIIRVVCRATSGRYTALESRWGHLFNTGRRIDAGAERIHLIIASM